MSVSVRSTLRSTLLWAVVPAAIVYAVALVWSGAEGISAKLVLKDLAQSCKAPLGEGFLSSVGYLLLDDMFLVHDRYLGEAFLYITYAFFTGLLLFRFRGPLRRFGGDTFLVSVVLLGLSVLTDALQGLWPNSYETVQIFEEGFKFLGIAAWLSFWCHYVSSASKPAALEQH